MDFLYGFESEFSTNIKCCINHFFVSNQIKNFYDIITKLKNKHYHSYIIDRIGHLLHKYRSPCEFEKPKTVDEKRKPFCRAIETTSLMEELEK